MAIIAQTSPRRLTLPQHARAGAQRSHRYVIPLLWLTMVAIATTVVIDASVRYRISGLEQQIPAWPAQPGSAAYLKRILVEPFFRWDALYHFLRIETLGYQANSAVLAFYPVYPMLARAGYLAGLDPAVSLLLVSWIFGIGYLFVFRRLASLDSSAREATWATLLLLVFPMSLMLFVPYMESLVLFLAAAALYFARLKWWWAAGLAAMLATLTKQPGIFLVIPLAYELAAEGLPRGRTFWSGASRWLTLAPAPIAMVLWTAFRSFTWDPGFAVTGSIPQIILRALVSSRAGEMVVSRPFAWPWQIIADAVNAAMVVPADRLNVLFNLGGYFLVVLLLAAAWRHLRPSYRAYVLALLIFTLLDYSFDGNAQPLTSMFRHAYLAFPVFLAVPNIVRDRVGRLTYVALGTAGFVVLLYAYVMNGWII